MTTLFLIRHAENDYVRAGKLAGRRPGVRLNAAGRQQAQALAERLRAVRLTALYTGPLERARETAAPLAAAQRLPAQVCAGLTEIDFGTWTGRGLKGLARTALWRVVQQTPSRLRFPGGESFGGAQARAVAAVERLVAAHRRGRVAVVTHADVIKLLVAYYLGLPLDHFQRLVVAPASVTVFQLEPGPATLVKFNDTGSAWSE